MILEELEKLPEAAAWPSFGRWLSLLNQSEVDKMTDFLIESGPEGRKQVLFFLRKLFSLARAGNVFLTHHHEVISGQNECMLRVCCFFCFQNKDVSGRDQWQMWFLPGGELTLMMLPKYTPAWFGETYNRLIAESRCWVDYEVRFPYDYFHFNYTQCLTCERLGAISLNPDVTAPRLLLELLKGMQHPDRLEKFLAAHPEAMSRDIWSLFSGEFWQAINSVEFPGWRDDFYRIFIDNISKGILNRQRVLKECLNAIGRNLSNNQISLYLPLFTALEPTMEELLELSGELLGVLGSPHSKAVAETLKLLRSISAEKNFPWLEFTGLLPVLLSLNVKSVQTPALALAEVLVKKTPQSRPELAPALLEAFGSPDEAIQLRAAKCLLSCGQEGVTNEVKNGLAGRLARMTVSTKELLAGLLKKTTSAAPPADLEEQAESQTGQRCKLDPAAKIKIPADLDELVFLMSSAFVEPADYHQSLVPDALYAFRDKLDDDLLVRLSPAVSAARRAAAQSTFTSTVHSRTTAIHFLRWYLARLAKSTSRDKSLDKIRKNADEIALQASSDWIVHFKPRFANDYLSWPFPVLYYGFSTLSRVTAAAFDRIDSGEPLPMLSSITHEPFWISPSALIDRLRIWQAAGREPEAMDLQLAIQRCAVETKDQALEMAQNLEGEYRPLMEYLLGEALPPLERIKQPAYWLTAALTRAERVVPDELLGPDFDDLNRSYFKRFFEWQLEIPDRWGIGQAISFDQSYVLTFNLTPYQSAEESASDGQQLAELPLKGAAADFFAGPMLLAANGSLLHQALALYPNNPEPLLMNYFIGFTTINSPQSLSIFQKLLEIGAVQGPAVSLFTALGFLSDGKEIRQTAAAFWRASVDEGLTDSSALGADLGKLVDHNWAPVKRLTELVETEMLNFGSEYSRRLSEIMETLLLRLSEEPQASIKRLLEIYYELTAAGIRPYCRELSPKIKLWSGLKAYDKICRRLLKFDEDDRR